MRHVQRRQGRRVGCGVVSALRGAGGRLLDTHGVPPRKQRILAPSMVDVEDTGGYSRQCIVSLRITDPINLTIYYVPMTRQMVDKMVDDFTRALAPTTNNTLPEDTDR